MFRSARTVGICVAFLAVMGIAGTSHLLEPAQAQESQRGVVMSVTKFKVPAADMATFMELTAEANQIHEGAGSVAEIRVWVEILAGEDFGTVIHTKEYPSFEEMAADYSLVHPTPEWQAFLEKFNASGAEAISNSLQFEAYP